MKEATIEALRKNVAYFQTKRATLLQELRQPTLALTDEQKRKGVEIFDARIEKRITQVLALQKSLPEHKDYDRYKVTGNDWYGVSYNRNEDYDQNQRMTSHDNKQRDAIIKQLDASIARLDRQARALKTQVAATADPVQRQT